LAGIYQGTVSPTTSPNRSSPGGSLASHRSTSSWTSYSSFGDESLRSGLKPAPVGQPSSVNATQRQPQHIQPHSAPLSYAHSGDAYANMQSLQGYENMHQPHLSAGSGHAASSGPSSLSQYPYQQPPTLQPQHSSYGAQHSSYSAPAYHQGAISPGGATGYPPSSMAGMLPGQVAQPLQLPGKTYDPIDETNLLTRPQRCLRARDRLVLQALNIRVNMLRTTRRDKLHLRE
jgi:hypothetical protein